jgi:HK97 family phage prohead protease
VFGTVDLGKDVVEPGAFARSLQKRKVGGIRMLYQHDPAQPIGVWTEIREDRRGLFVRGRLTPGVWRAQEVLALLRSGALDGLSIGFRAARTRRDPASGIRRIVEADLWEISVVRRPKTAATDESGAHQLTRAIRHAISIINPKGRSL